LFVFFIPLVTGRCAGLAIAASGLRPWPKEAFAGRTPEAVMCVKKALETRLSRT